MTLDDYLLTAPHGERRRFARALGVSESTIHRWRRGHVFPGKQRIQEIEYETGGAVRPADWFDTAKSRE